MPNIQIIITHYNKGPLLERAVSSLLLPGNSGFSRVILIDDGSSDTASLQTWRRVRRRYGTDPRFLFLEQPVNRGSSAALNTAIHHCTEGIIMQLDADDLLPDGAVGAVARAVAEHPGCDFIAGDYWQDGILVSNRRLFPDGKLKRSRVAKHYTLPGVTPYSLRLWQLAGGYDERVRMLNDMDFFLRAMERGEFSSCYVAQPLYDWRMREGGKSIVCRRREISAMFFRHYRFYARYLKKPALYRESVRHALAWGLDLCGAFEVTRRLFRKKSSR